MNDEAPIIPVFVDATVVPSPEAVIRAAVDRVIEVVSARVERQFAQLIRVERRFAQEVGVGRAQNFERFFNDFAIRPERRADALVIKRDERNPLALVRLVPLFPFENRNRTVPEEIVRLPHDVRD